MIAAATQQEEMARRRRINGACFRRKLSKLSRPGYLKTSRYTPPNLVYTALPLNFLCTSYCPHYWLAMLLILAMVLSPFLCAQSLLDGLYFQ